MHDTYLDSVVRKVPDYPKPGILFYDITSILLNPEAYAYCIDKLCESVQKTAVDALAAIEARGFLFAGPAAVRLGLPLILLRKKGKLPGKTLRREFDLEYGSDEIHVQVSDIQPDTSILLVDDLLATGGTISAAAGLIEEAGGRVAEIFAVLGLPFLGYGKALGGYTVSTLHDYRSE